jgi:DNA repair protein RadC
MSLALVSPFADTGFVDRSAEDLVVKDLIRPLFDPHRERLVLMSFCAAMHLISVTETLGLPCRSVIFQPVALRQLLMAPAAQLLLVAHNHPSDEASPSRADIELTKRLAQVSALADLRLTDHLILTRHGHFSFHAAGLL